MTCEHLHFEGRIDVNRMEDSGAFIVDLRVNCADCKQPFEFVGFPPGLSFGQPMTSLDNCELHLPIVPRGSVAVTDLPGFRVQRTS